MDLSKVVLINFVDKRRLADDDPHVTIQRLVRYERTGLDAFNDPSGKDLVGGSDDGENAQVTEEKKVLSLTRKHWRIYDTLVDDHNVKPHVLIDAVKKYQKFKPCHFDQGMEICLEMIWHSYADRDGAGDMNEAAEEDEIQISDGDVNISRLLH